MRTDVFGLLSGRRLEVFRQLAEREMEAATAADVAGRVGIGVDGVRNALRLMVVAGLVRRIEGAFARDQGRRPDRYLIIPEVREWWKHTKQVFGVN